MRPFDVLAGRDALQHLDCDAALEQVVQHDQPLEQVAAEPVDFLHGQHVALAQVGQGGGQAGTVVGAQLARHLLFEEASAH
jgi:hypothetical protein